MSEQATETSLRVCPDCGQVCHLPPPRAGYNICCPRCDKAFARTRQHSVPWMFACTISGLIFYVTVLTAPFLEVIVFGRDRVSTMETGIAALNNQHMASVAGVIILTAVIMPLLKLSGLLTVFGGLQAPKPPQWIVPLFRDLKYINAWSMVEIYLLGALVAYTRMRALAHVQIDTAVFALIGMVLSMVSVDAILDPEAVWEDMERKGLTRHIDVPPGHAITGCDNCHQANAAGTSHCTRCGVELHHRKPSSISRTWALVAAAAIFYIPANLFPIMQVTRLERSHSYTIIRGVQEFIHAGLWPLALLVFVASIVIPLIKLLTLVVMLVTARRQSPAFLLVRTRAYRFIDFIGRWSMIDIFMLSILVGLMQFGIMARIQPEQGAVYFTAVVIITMFAVGSFDPRLMWDAVQSAKIDWRKAMSNNRPHDDNEYPAARERIRRFSFVWLIPIVAAIIAVYLGIHDYASHGPLIEVTFKTAQGLSVGQTQVKYKSVTMGTVENIKFDKDMQNVIVSIRMTGPAEPLLTKNARFWVVRPEFNTFNASEFETLVSGSYIRISPGPANNNDQSEVTHFTGLETPPADSSEEPGKIFILKSERLDSLNIGSPVYFRDINVGQILGYDIGSGFEPITITAFVREPYDKYVRRQSRFWNTSGLTMKLGGGGLHLETHSLRSVLSGGVSFLTPEQAQSDSPADAMTVFNLYDTQDAAKAAVYDHSVLYTAYFKSSVKDLVPGAPVMIYGLQVGSVTNVALDFKPDQPEPRVRVDFNIQPERVFGPATIKQTPDTTAIMRQMVADGMRVKLDAGTLIIGQKGLVLEFTPNAEPAPVAMEGDAIVLPSAGGGENVMDALGDVANKLNQIPFAEIGNNLNNLLKSANQSIGSSDMKDAIHNLSITMANAADLTGKADQNMTPALQRLPDISAQIQEAVRHANGVMSGLDTSFGEGSDFQRDARRTLDQVNDAARSIRLLADFLERHPEALLSGKSYEKDKP